MGNVFGTPYKVVLCLLGLVVAGSSATGVIIWWRKLRSRHAMHRRKAAHVRLAARSAAVRSLAALLCLVASILLAGTLIGAVQNVLWGHSLFGCRTQGQDGPDHSCDHYQNND
jgi:uncharacterized iron-regulated membrane protein